MNLLFTCAGRRNYLLQYFRDVLDDRSRIIAADMQLSAPAMTVADKAFSVPGVYSEKYIEIIMDICVKEKIDAIISLNDLELPVLASAENIFAEIGVKLIVSDKKAIEICFDKYKTFYFCKELEVDTPKTFLTLAEAENAVRTGDLKLPVVVKPRWGSASIGIEFPETIKELVLAYRLVSLKILHSPLREVSIGNPNKAVMIQEKIIGIEYGLDILNDFARKSVIVYAKQKLAMRAGETDKAVLRNKPDLEKVGFKIGNALGHIGNLDCDIFESNGNYFLIEMNPRFGGGYPFSHKAGANFPAALCSWIEGRTFNPANFIKEYDQPYAKCDTLIKILKEE